MPTVTENSRITYNPDRSGGRRCIRGMRIRVSDILDMLADSDESGQSFRSKADSDSD